MHYIEITDILKTKYPNSNAVMIGKTKNSVLIGPIFDSRICANCVRLRLIASGFVSPKAYRKTQQDDAAFINKKIAQGIPTNTMLEFIIQNDSWHLKQAHYILPVPGCTTCYA